MRVNNNFFCIGISGQKQTGKDTLCNIIKPILSKELNTNFSHTPFATGVRQIMRLLYYVDNQGEKNRVDNEFIEYHKEKKDYIPLGWNMNIRDAMVHIGEGLREISPTIWVDDILCKPCNKIITDVRYDNEIEAIKKNKGMSIIFKMYRQKHRNLNPTSKSESELIKYDRFISSDFDGPINHQEVPYDYIVRNDGTIEDLKIKVHQYIIPFILNKWKYFC